MDINDIRSAVTVLGLVLFSGLMVWTWWPGRRDAFDHAAQLPFDDEGAAQ